MEATLKRVLIIDDDVELLRQMATAFQAAGYAVEAAPDGQIGLQKYEAQPADLVVTDIIMPVKEGVETIMALRRAKPAPRIVAISGGLRAPSAEFLNLARLVGADRVLAKPFRHAELLTMAAGLLELQPTVAAA